MIDLNSISRVNIKAKVENKFLESLKSIQHLYEPEINNEANYTEIYDEALILFQKSVSKPYPLKKDLSEAAIKFIQVIKLNNNAPEPYMCLAYIYYILGNDDLGMKYYNFSRMLDTECLNSSYLDGLKTLMTNKLGDNYEFYRRQKFCK